MSSRWVSSTWSIPPASSIARTRARFQCGASTRNGSRAWGTSQAWAPKERRSLCPQRNTPGATCIGKARGGAARRLVVPMERVGQASAAPPSATPSRGGARGRGGGAAGGAGGGGGAGQRGPPQRHLLVGGRGLAGDDRLPAVGRGDEAG